MVRFGRWGVAGKGANDSSISFRQATSPAPLQYLPSKRPVPTSSPATTLWPIAAKTQMAEKIEMDNLLFMEVSPIRGAIEIEHHRNRLLRSHFSQSVCKGM